ncbi:sugar phosphate nucleotidyltransferase [Synechococcus sp. PCC 7336]|uniref:sugar phosphate nucleotidyltransferase n=1 Tax=Synechococcus sp. PCC 7336 TaxID=195250 RepID=UPI00034C67D0|nr:NDP-sugar synthase [Synechococcus sp. PCC 7336]
MKAMILAAGKGTRVRPITYLIPKPMIPIMHKPVMEFLVELLKQHGFNQIMVNTSHLADQIETYFRDGQQWGVQMAFSFEGHFEDGEPIAEALGSGGGLRKIQDFSGFFDETFVVLCGDALIDLNLTQVVNFHKAKGSIATIVMREVPEQDVPSYGVVVTDAEGKIQTFQEKPSVEEALSNTINTGIYIFEPEIFNYIPSGCEYDIGGDLFPKLVEAGAPFYGVAADFQWVDIGRTPDYYEAIQKVLKGEVNAVEVPGTEISPGVWVGLNVRANWDKVEITPPVYIGGSTWINDGTKIIGPSAIGSGCILNEGCTIDKSVIFDYTHVARGVNLSQRMVLGKYCMSADGQVIDTEENDLSWLIGDARCRIPTLESPADSLSAVESLVGVAKPS